MASITANLLAVTCLYLAVCITPYSCFEPSRSPSEILGIDPTRGAELYEVRRDDTENTKATIIKYQLRQCGVDVKGSQAVLEVSPDGGAIIADNKITGDNESRTDTRLPSTCSQTGGLSKIEILHRVAAQEGDDPETLAPFKERYDAKDFWILHEGSMRRIVQLTYVVEVNNTNSTSEDGSSEDSADQSTNASPTRKIFYVDTKTYEILLREEMVVSFAYQMTGLGGNEVLGKHQYGNWEWAGRKLLVDHHSHENWCAANNIYVSVANAGGTWSCPSTSFIQTCNSYTILNGFSYNQVNDALYYTHNFLEMLRDRYGDLSLPSYCGPISACVNIGGLDNAYWSSCTTRYGLGNTNFWGLATADVVAHELCHGVTEAVSGLNYWAESGGMNEAFSDICGETYEAFLHHGNNDWKIGYGIMRNPSGKDALRYMSWPPKDDLSIQCQADYYGQGVHFTSGIYNKAFYNLANKPGWCIERAFEVFLRANKYSWTSTTTFNSGACGVTWAAYTFGYNWLDVEDAFAEVGVFCNCPWGFIKRNNWSCYKIVRDLASWSEAKVTCEALGSTLAVVDDSTEFNWIQTQLQAYYTQAPHHDFNTQSAYWIGASDQGSEGAFQWLSVSPAHPVSYTAWGNGQPDNQNGFQNCVAMVSFYFNYYFSYFDEDCQDRKYFLCERTCKHYNMNT